MDVPITQSTEWRQLQDDLGEQSFFEATDTYQYLAIVKRTKVGAYLYLPYGPVARSEAAFQKALSILANLAQKCHAIFIRIEPQNPAYTHLLPASAIKVKDLEPADTWVLDLTPDKPTLLTNFSQGTRTRYNTYAKKGLVVETTKDPSMLSHLIAFQRQLFSHKHLTAYDAHYLATELKQPFATLYLVKYSASKDTSHLQATAAQKTGNYPADSQVLAASLFFDYAGTRYYMQSAADQNYKKLPATVALLTKAIFDAKEQGITQFDFWGIAPDDAPADHPWKGFTEFKKSFGGFAKHYAGTYDIVLNPTKYHLYQLLCRLKRKLK